MKMVGNTVKLGKLLSNETKYIFQIEKKTMKRKQNKNV